MARFKFLMILLISLGVNSLDVMAQGKINPSVSSKKNNKNTTITKKAGEDEFNTATHLFHGTGGYSTNYESAAYWYKQAAEKGHYLAQNDLAVMYQYGIGVPINNYLALKWYKKAADQGYPAAKASVELMSLLLDTSPYYQTSFITIYYSDESDKLTREHKNILEAIAKQIKSHPTQHFILTGWKSNYTGTDASNNQIRRNRVNGVYNYLINSCGVQASQLSAVINSSNFSDTGMTGGLTEEALNNIVTINVDNIK